MSPPPTGRVRRLPWVAEAEPRFWYGSSFAETFSSAVMALAVWSRPSAAPWRVVGPAVVVAGVASLVAAAATPGGTATGTLNFMRQLGGAIIVAAFGAIVLGCGLLLSAQEDEEDHGAPAKDRAHRRKLDRIIERSRRAGR